MAPSYAAAIYVPPTIKPKKGYLFKPEYNVIWGGTLNTDAGSYVRPGINMGTTGGEGLGLLDGFSFNIDPQSAPITGSNVNETGLREITAEQCTIDLTLKTWNIPVLSAFLSNGNVYEIDGGNEVAMTFGGGARLEAVPLVLHIRNTSANTPETPGLLSNGIRGIFATFYSCTPSSPLNFDQLLATENKTLSLQFTASRELDRPAGAQTGVLYVY